MRFIGTNSGNFKMLIALGKKGDTEINQYSIDTGNGSNIFQPNYFTMNRDHLDGKLQKMIIGKEIAKVKTETLVIKPLEKKATNKAVSEDL